MPVGERLFATFRLCTFNPGTKMPANAGVLGLSDQRGKSLGEGGLEQGKVLGSNFLWGGGVPGDRAEPDGAAGGNVRHLDATRTASGIGGLVAIGGQLAGEPAEAALGAGRTQSFGPRPFPFTGCPALSAALNLPARGLPQTHLTQLRPPISWRSPRVSGSGACRPKLVRTHWPQPTSAEPGKLP